MKKVTIFLVSPLFLTSVFVIMSELNKISRTIGAIIEWRKYD